MNMLRRPLLLYVSCLAVAPLTFGCGSSSNSEDDDEVVLDDGEDGDDDDDDDDDSDDDGSEDGDCGEATSVALGEVTVGVDVPTWKNDAAGAYTIFHDDTCWDFESSHFNVVAPALEQRGLVAAFGMVAAGCDGWDPVEGQTGVFEKADWDQWETVNVLGAAGHELVNHSFSHNPIDGSWGYPYDIQQEISVASDLLRAGAKYPIEFYIFPTDLFSDAHLEELGRIDYIGARAGSKGSINGADDLDPFRLNFDVHASPTGVGANAHQLVELDEYVAQAIDGGGYAIREFHAVVGTLDPDPATSTWQILTSEYEEHLDSVEARVNAGELWVTGPSTAIRYQKAKELCSAPSYADGSLRFDEPSADCTRYGTELSFTVETDVDYETLGGSQDGRCLQVVRLAAGTYYVNVDPARGDAKLWGQAP